MYKVFTLVMIVILSLLRTDARSQVDDAYWIAYIGIPQLVENPPCAGLCIVRSDGSEVRALTEDILFASFLSWSPDGSNIIFVNTNGDLVSVDIATGLVATIFSYDAQLKYVTNQEMFRDFYPHNISPIENVVYLDENTILITIKLVMGVAYTPGNVYRLDLIANNVEAITDNNVGDVEGLVSISLSRSTDAILMLESSLCRYCGFYGTTLHMVDLENGVETRISEAENWLDTNAMWSNNDDYIYYIHWQNYEYESANLMRVDRVALENEVVLRDLSLSIQTDVAITENYLYYLDASISCSNVHIININTGNITIYPDNQTVCFSEISLNPNLQYVALNGATASLFGGAGVYVMNSNGEYHTVINGYAEIYSVIWSPVSLEG